MSVSGKIERADRNCGPRERAADEFKTFEIG
jgi:hypothetical protein